MAKQIVCDICGYKMGPSHLFQGYKLTSYHISKFWSDKLETRNFDVCSDCMNKIIENVRKEVVKNP